MPNTHPHYLYSDIVNSIKDTKTNIQAMTSLLDGTIAYATDTDEFGIYSANLNTWTWLGTGSSISVQDEGVPLGTATTFNFIGDNVIVTVSGSVARVYVTGSSSGSGTVPYAPGGRLTLVTGTPILSSAQTAKTAIYWTPYIEDLAPFYDGINWTENTLIELTLNLDSNSGHTGYHQSGKNFDLFLYNDTGTKRLVSSPAWTNDSTRAIALEQVNGILMNATSMTARFGSGAGDTIIVAQDRGVFVGTFRASADGQTEWSDVKKFLWNYYNQVPQKLYVEQYSLHTYNGADRKWNNSDTNNKLEFIIGKPENYLAGISDALYAGAAGNFAIVKLFLDGAEIAFFQIFNYNPYYLGGGNSRSGLAMDGYHYIQTYETGNHASSTFAWMYMHILIMG